MGIPAKVSASGAVAKNQRFEGEISVSALPRLAEVAQAADAPLAVSLGADQKLGYPRLSGEISGTVRLSCGRCDKPYEFGVHAPVDLRLVTTEQEEHDLLSECDPYMVKDDELPLREVIEDEVLLALPMLPRCESCENIVNQAPQAAPPVEERRENPFAALKNQLKH